MPRSITDKAWPEVDQDREKAWWDEVIGRLVVPLKPGTVVTEDTRRISVRAIWRSKNVRTDMIIGVPQGLVATRNKSVWAERSSAPGV
jgi:hypothetical protein